MLCSVHALFEGYNEIKEALSKLADDYEQMAETRLEASTHAQDHGQLETAILLALWHYILNRFNEVSKAMQKSDVLLSTVIKLFKSLICYVDDIREQFTVYESNARSRLPDSNCSDANRRVRKRSIQIRFFDGPSLDTAMDARSIFSVSTFLPIADSLKTELDRRGGLYGDP